MESKIILAVGGIVVVLAAVGCSLGIFGYIGVTTTMLTIEVSQILPITKYLALISIISVSRSFLS